MKELRPKTPIKNFYMTGQDIVTVGIGGALMSGVITAAHVSKNFWLVDKIVDTVLKEREQAKETA
jgi:hypothetical protein